MLVFRFSCRFVVETGGLNGVITSNALLSFGCMLSQDSLNLENRHGVLMDFLVWRWNDDLRNCVFEMGTFSRNHTVSLTDHPHAQPGIKRVGLDDADNVVVFDPRGGFRG